MRPVATHATPPSRTHSHTHSQPATVTTVNGEVPEEELKGAPACEMQVRRYHMTVHWCACSLSSQQACDAMCTSAYANHVAHCWCAIHARLDHVPCDAQAAGCGGFGKGNFSELFKRIEDYERTLNI